MRIRSKIRYVRHFLGLGISGEKHTQYDENHRYFWSVVHIKIFMGLWVWGIDINFREKKAVPDEW